MVLPGSVRLVVCYDCRESVGIRCVGTGAVARGAQGREGSEQASACIGASPSGDARRDAESQALGGIPTCLEGTPKGWSYLYETEICVTTRRSNRAFAGLATTTYESNSRIHRYSYRASQDSWRDTGSAAAT